MKLAFGLPLSFVSSVALATGSSSLVLDIEVAPVGPVLGASSPTPLLFDGSFSYLSARTAGTGYELWRTDGVTTVLVKDVLSGPGSGDPREMVRLPGGTVVFAATDAEGGRELWRTDGTEAGTVRVIDLAPGGTSSAPFGLTLLQGKVLFFADDGVRGRELWSTDGTAAGTTLVRDLVPGPAGGGPDLALGGRPVAVGGTLFFGGRSAAHAGWSLWRSDGTPAGTVEVAAITASIADPLAALTSFQGKVAFAARHPTAGEEPWQSDGTAAGTNVVDVEPGPSGSAPAELVAAGATLFFSADAAGSGRELWASDGTPGGTRMVANLGTGTGAYLGSKPGGIVAFGARVFFSATTIAAGPEPWISDGTAAGTVLLRDVKPGFSGSVPQEARAFAGRILFSADDGASGRELWATDGTAGGTVMVADVKPGPGSSRPERLLDAGTHVLFAADDGVSYAEPWRTDGTAAGTNLVTDVETASTQSSGPGPLLRLGERLLFVAGTSSSGRELWLSDGTASGTQPLLDLYPGPVGSEPRDLIEVSGRAFFTANVPGVGRDPFVTDGTAAGTTLVKDVRPGALGSNPAGLAPYQGGVVFQADDGLHGIECWRSDGTAAGTQLLADIVLGADSSAPSFFREVGDVLLFVAYDVAVGIEPMKLENATVTPLKDVYPGGFGSVLGDPRFTHVAGRTYFAATDGAHGVELWRSDGTPAGTSLLKDLAPGLASSMPASFVPWGADLLFLADDGTFGRQLWRTDGTTTGTTRVTSLGLPPAGKGIEGELFARDGDVLFVVNDGATRTLFSSDGTAAGTSSVAVIDPSGSQPTGALSWQRVGSGPHVVFQAADAVHGREPWITDGSAAFTGVLEDVAPGPAGSSAAGFVRAGAHLFFAANDGVTGNELHAIPLLAMGEFVAETFGEGCPGSQGVPTLTVTGGIHVGAPFTLTLAKGAANGLALVLVGLGHAYLPMAGGCLQHVALPLVVAGLPTGPGGGFAAAVTPPAAAAGFSAVLQAFPLDPQGAHLGQASATAGLEIVVGP